mgnify:CR=1 FL=1
MSAPGPESPPSPRNIILRRICVIQVGIIVAATVLLFVMMSRQFGFFWHTFMLGGLGASIALQRKITTKSPEELEYLSGDRIAIAMPVLYGAVMAAVTYGLFMSNLVSGDSQGALLSSNVFPRFVVADLPSPDLPNLDEGEKPVKGTEGKGVTWNEFFRMRPATTEDLGKLLVWCFLAGYSESFVTGLLSRLESTGSKPGAKPAGKSAPSKKTSA